MPRLSPVLTILAVVQRLRGAVMKGSLAGLNRSLWHNWYGKLVL